MGGMSKLQFKRYLKISEGSVKECIALTTLSRLRGYIDINQERTLRNFCIELSKMLSGLINSLIDSQLQASNLEYSQYSFLKLVENVLLFSTQFLSRRRNTHV